MNGQETPIEEWDQDFVLRAILRRDETAFTAELARKHRPRFQVFSPLDYVLLGDLEEGWVKYALQLMPHCDISKLVLGNRQTVWCHELLKAYLADSRLTEEQLEAFLDWLLAGHYYAHSKKEKLNTSGRCQSGTSRRHRSLSAKN